MLVNHKIQIFWIILFVGVNVLISIGMEGSLATHVTFLMWTVRGKAISEFRSPNALPRAPTPLGTELVLHLRCVTRLTFVCMLRYSEWDAVPIWVPGFFGTYSGMVYWAGFRILQYLQWNVILSWFPNSSIFIMSRYSNPSSGLFGICAETLRRYSCPFTIPGQDAPRPLPSPIRVLSFFLSVGNISQRERISVRAVAEEGWYNLGPGRGRYCGRVSCLSQRRVLALPQCF